MAEVSSVGFGMFELCIGLWLSVRQLFLFVYIFICLVFQEIGTFAFIEGKTL